MHNRRILARSWHLHQYQHQQGDLQLHISLCMLTTSAILAHPCSQTACSSSLNTPSSCSKWLASGIRDAQERNVLGNKEYVGWWEALSSNVEARARCTTAHDIKPPNAAAMSDAAACNKASLSGACSSAWNLGDSHCGHEPAPSTPVAWCGRDFTKHFHHQRFWG